MKVQLFQQFVDKLNYSIGIALLASLLVSIPNSRGTNLDFFLNNSPAVKGVWNYLTCILVSHINIK